MMIFTCTQWKLAITCIMFQTSDLYILHMNFFYCALYCYFRLMMILAVHQNFCVLLLALFIHCGKVNNSQQWPFFEKCNLASILNFNTWMTNVCCFSCDCIVWCCRRNWVLLWYVHHFRIVKKQLLAILCHPVVECSFITYYLCQNISVFYFIFTGMTFGIVCAYVCMLIFSRLITMKVNNLKWVLLVSFWYCMFYIVVSYKLKPVYQWEALFVPSHFLFLSTLQCEFRDLWFVKFKQLYKNGFPNVTCC